MRKISCCADKIPTLVYVMESNWLQNKSNVLKHCLSLLNDGSEQKLILLLDKLTNLPEITDELKKITSKTIIIYNPANENNDYQNFNGMTDNYILIMCENNFIGCESSDVIHIGQGAIKSINSSVSSFKKLVCIHILDQKSKARDIFNSSWKHVKEDYTFL